ncbi:hypothetical protein A374_09104 [Fictibacillus macauensis ZFHKF-1]|uniref:Beta-carotene 15,15'-monooxygenase n=1 Tax=Fictibacillus macauensis ZFHKF-1 TaxID=1196324 RepID=I8AJN5_9BACL|nr:hypothetical protein [Fictibacillus macauensis]EIT85982.1 hypothetical protein A374_09104 [Fictibacillus macauensis ZFHKF-1]
MLVKKYNARLFLFLGLSSLLFMGNILVYRIQFIDPLAKESVYATLLDCLFVWPLLVYLFFLRKRRLSLRYASLTLLVGVGSATFIIPQSFKLEFPSIIRFCLSPVGFGLLLVLFICTYILLLFLKVQRIIRNEQNVPSMQFIRSMHAHETGGFHTMIALMTFYDLLFCSWKRHKRVQGKSYFSYHKKTSSMAFQAMLIHALVIESVGFHYVLISFHPMLAWLMLSLNSYTILYTLANIQAIRTQPITFDGKRLIIYKGLTSVITLPLSELESIERYNGPEQLPKSLRKRTFNAVLAEFTKEKPAFEMVLKKPHSVFQFIGKSSKVDRIHVTVDDDVRFYEQIQKAIENEKAG